MLLKEIEKKEYNKIMDAILGAYDVCNCDCNSTAYSDIMAKAINNLNYALKDSLLDDVPNFKDKFKYICAEIICDFSVKQVNHSCDYNAYVIKYYSLILGCL